MRTINSLGEHCTRQESNLNLRLRRPPLYPFNYGCVCLCGWRWLPRLGGSGKRFRGAMRIGTCVESAMEQVLARAGVPENLGDLRRETFESGGGAGDEDAG